MSNIYLTFLSTYTKHGLSFLLSSILCCWFFQSELFFNSPLVKRFSLKLSFHCLPPCNQLADELDRKFFDCFPQGLFQYEFAVVFCAIVRGSSRKDEFTLFTVSTAENWVFKIINDLNDEKVFRATVSIQSIELIKALAVAVIK